MRLRKAIEEPHLRFRNARAWLPPPQERMLSAAVVGPRERVMKPKDPKDSAARRAVSKRLRRFFAELTAQLGAGSAEIWAKVERRLAPKRNETGAADAPMQSQPEQQQQAKATDKDVP